MTEVPSIGGVWFPAVRAYSGTDVFTLRLARALQARGVRTEITWLPLRAEYCPWSVRIPAPPRWASVAHVTSWFHPRFFPASLPVLSTVHFCVHDLLYQPYKNLLQKFYHSFWIRDVERRNLSRSSVITAVSGYTARQTEKAFHISPIRVVPNGIPLDGPFQMNLRAKPHHPFRLLYVGNWSKRKGVDLLAPLMKRLGRNFELWFTADRGNKHLAYRLPKNCRCIGRLSKEDELSRIYQKADALLFPSRLEGLSLVALEAMACGLPVIAVRTTSLPEVVDHGRSGILCARHDVSELAAACQSLRQDLPRWRAMQEASRRRVEELFSEDRMVGNYLRLYAAAATSARWSVSERS